MLKAAASKSCFALALFLASCASDVPPVVEASELSDTRDPFGPYSVTARVFEERGLSEVRLHHRASTASRPDIVSMEEILPGRFEAGIPGYPSGTRVHWFIEAEDIHGNLGYAPPLAEWGDHSCVESWGPEQEKPSGGASFCFSVLF